MPQTSPLDSPTCLRQPKDQVEQTLRHRIDKGIEIRDRLIQSESQLAAARNDYHIWDDYDEIRNFRADVSEKVQCLESLVHRLDLFEEITPVQTAVPQPAELAAANRRVFVVHGRDEGSSSPLRGSLRRLNSPPLSSKNNLAWDGPSSRNSRIRPPRWLCSCAAYSGRRRQAGWIGQLRAEARSADCPLRVGLLQRGELEMPSDLAGVECLSYDGDWQLKLAREM
jgi:hypothetical protein